MTIIDHRDLLVIARSAQAAARATYERLAALPEGSTGRGRAHAIGVWAGVLSAVLRAFEVDEQHVDWIALWEHVEHRRDARGNARTNIMLDDASLSPLCALIERQIQARALRAR